MQFQSYLSESGGEGRKLQIPLASGFLASALFTDRNARKQGGFSLVEICMAIGLVCFALMPILGLLPIGLNTVRQSVVQAGESGISRQMRSKLESVTLAEVINLNGKTDYYTQQGIPVDKNDANVYFSAEFDVVDPVVVGAVKTFDESAKNVQITLSFPLHVPLAAQQSKVLSFLVSGQ